MLRLCRGADSSKHRRVQAATTPSGPAATFTGERPGWGEGFDYDYSRHLAAYRYAAGLVAGLRVLDAGCGEGFGTQSLAGTAAHVTGYDYSAAAIAECRRLWPRPDLDFQCVDLSAPPLPGADFDAVLSFQVLEHMTDPLAFLRALRSLVTEGGFVLLTTPNRPRTVSENPFHVREYDAGELVDLLKNVFGHVSVVGMYGNEKVEAFERSRARAVASILRLDPLGLRRLLPRAIVEPAFARLAALVRRRAKAEAPVAIVPEDFAVGTGDDIDLALDLVALCRP